MDEGRQNFILRIDQNAVYPLSHLTNIQVALGSLATNNKPHYNCIQDIDRKSSYKTQLKIYNLIW